MTKARQAAGAQARPRKSDIPKAICAELIGSDTASAVGISITAYTPVLELCPGRWSPPAMIPATPCMPIAP